MNDPTHKLLSPTSEYPFGSVQELPIPVIDWMNQNTPREMATTAYPKYEKYISFLKTLPLTSELKGVKVGDLVTKDKDFKEQHQQFLPPTLGNYSKWIDVPDNYENIYDRKTRIVAIPIEKKIEDTPVKGIEETQDHLWNEVGNIIHGGTSFTFYEKYMTALKEKFTITRK